MDSRTYTLREIAREMNLPESTLRYYRDAFELHIPTVGLGRRRRYPGASREIFQLIADGFAQNLAREDIESRIQEVAPATASRAVTHAAPVRFQRQSETAAPTEELVSTIIDSERERRDIMWQLAREIVRMGETLERQQLTLMQITQHLDWGANRALPAGPSLSPIPYTGAAQPPVPDGSSLNRELTSLREELERERELVERLRRAKLEIERRATAAEAELERRAESPDMGALRRFLGKEQP
jgi:DNA-binding transcriptional MerR regulator